MSLLRYGQYGQVGVDGVWREKETQKAKQITGISSATAWCYIQILVKIDGLEAM